MEKLQLADTVSFDEAEEVIAIIDQRLLPGEYVMLSLKTQPEIWEAIKTLAVRGAPAIGVTAAYGLYLAALDIAKSGCGSGEFGVKLTAAKAYLASSRPTAVNLFWALDRMERVYIESADEKPGDIAAKMKLEADKIRDEDIAASYAIGLNGLSLLKNGDGILTHCNAGQLATVRYGTALAPIHVGIEKGYRFKVFCDETRPLLQGARLSAYELSADGVDTTVICDNMASTVMKNGWINAVITGADRIAANGDSANKIGTSGVAILAKYYGIPFYIAAPTSTVDMALSNGSLIPIEQRDPSEVTELWYKKRMAPEDVKAFNPAFDVTDSSLITAIITEKGVCRPPFDKSLGELMKGVKR